ncbi:MAG: anthranilate phosphoribosyltransferase [Gemmatimonadales bacterium]
MRAGEVLDVLSRRDLSREESTATFRRFLSAEYSEIEMAAVLAALKTRGETPEVMAGAVEALLEAAVPFPRPDYDFADCCGTGGDGAGTVNVSTAAAFLAAELGIPMAKAGNRSVSSRCGSADVLERVGVRLDLAPERARRCLDEVGICFVFAPHYHAGVRHVAPVRKALGVRTVFNLVGPIANAARPTWQLMGTYHPTLCEPAARTLALLGRKVAFAVHGSGLDEVALHGGTTGVLIRDGRVESVTITPGHAGVTEASLDALAGGGPEENADWLVRVLEGKGSRAHAEAVALNAGTLAWATGKLPTLRAAVRVAREVLGSGTAARRLTRLVELSRDA